MTGLSPVAHKSVETSLIFGNISGPNIKTGTSITVRWTAATGALMKEQHSRNISKTYTSRSQWQMLRASKLSVQNATRHFHRKTKCGPIYSSVEIRTNLFLVQNVMKLSGIGMVYVFIRSKNTHRGQGIVVLTTNVTFVPKNIHPFHQGGNTWRVCIKSKCWVGLLVSRSRTIASNVLVN